MINTIQSKYEGLLTPPFLEKKDNPRVPTIECLINQKVFQKTFYDIGLGVKVAYEYLFGNELLYPTYMQLQMADQLVRFLEGIVKDVIVQIQDRYVPADFMVLDIGIEEETSIILGRPFLNTINAVIYIESGQVYF
jgi:hypothetical protein